MGCPKVLQRILGLMLAGVLLSGCCSMDAARGYVLPRVAMEYARRHPTPTRVRVRRTPTRAPVAAGSTPTEPAPTVMPAALYVPEGWKLYEKPKDGFAIALPPTWQEIDVDAETFDALMGQLESQNPEMAEVLKGQAHNQMLASTKLWALDLGPESVATGFIGSINIIKERLPVKVSLDFYAQSLVGQIENYAVVVQPVTHQRVQLPAGEAEEVQVHVRMQQINGQTLAMGEMVYLFIQGSDIYQISLATAEEQFEEKIPTFESIAQSFRYLD